MKKPRKELYLFITYLKLRTEHCHFLDSIRMLDVNRNSQLIEHFVPEKSESQMLSISHTNLFVHNFISYIISFSYFIHIFILFTLLNIHTNKKIYNRTAALSPEWPAERVEDAGHLDSRPTTISFFDETIEF